MSWCDECRAWDREADLWEVVKYARGSKLLKIPPSWRDVLPTNFNWFVEMPVIFTCWCGRCAWEVDCFSLCVKGFRSVAWWCMQLEWYISCCCYAGFCFSAEQFVQAGELVNSWCICAFHLKYHLEWEVNKLKQWTRWGCNRVVANLFD